ncbi:MAG TPA: TetR family transcriptional regulator [Acidimicrobiales bacterium]|nr:TetR family transcriptional regulator [Acidimicrobiales bacterium]
MADGLRERKKARTRDDLRRCARELFRTQGYEATTVAQIAAFAEVSEPTFFRYFPSKVDVALAPLADAMAVTIDTVVARPPDEAPLTACTAVAVQARDAGFVPVAGAADELRALRTTAALSAAVVTLFDQATDRLTDDFARRLGVEATDVVARQTAAAVMATMLAVFRTWADDPQRVDPAAAAIEGFERLRRGLR